MWKKSVLVKIREKLALYNKPLYKTDKQINFYIT